MPNTPAVYTIGHSNHSEQHFLDLLTKHGIQVLADVRSQPFSKYTPHFNREYLQGTLRDCRMKYLFMGDQLGGRPEGDEFYDAKVTYSTIDWPRPKLFSKESNGSNQGFRAIGWQ